MSAEIPRLNDLLEIWEKGPNPRDLDPRFPGWQKYKVSWERVRALMVCAASLEIWKDQESDTFVDAQILFAIAYAIGQWQTTTKEMRIAYKIWRRARRNDPRTQIELAGL